jgi:hypothetical protein
MPSSTTRPFSCPRNTDERAGHSTRPAREETVRHRLSGKGLAYRRSVHGSRPAQIPQRVRAWEILDRSLQLESKLPLTSRSETFASRPLPPLRASSVYLAVHLGPERASLARPLGDFDRAGARCEVGSLVAPLSVYWRTRRASPVAPLAGRTFCSPIASPVRKSLSEGSRNRRVPVGDTAWSNFLRETSRPIAHPLKGEP